MQMDIQLQFGMIIDYDKFPLNILTASFLRKQFLKYLKIVGISLRQWRNCSERFEDLYLMANLLIQCFSIT